MSLGTAGGGIGGGTTGGRAGGGVGLGDRLFGWLRNLWSYAASVPPLSYMLDLLDMFHGALEGKPLDATREAIDILGSLPLPTALIYSQLIAAITGKSKSSKSANVFDELNSMRDDPSGYFAKKVSEISTSQSVLDASNVFAELIQKNLLEKIKVDPNSPAIEPFKIAAELIAGAAVIKAAAGAVGTSAEVLGLGQIKSVSEQLVDLSNLLSPTVIVERVIDPALSVGLMPAIERAYNALYRPQRLSPRDLTVLQGFGLVDEPTYRKEGSEEGYRDEDLDRVKELMRQRVTPGDAQSARDLGMIDDGELFQRYKFWRYSEEDAAFLMQLNATERHQSWNERMLSILLRNYITHKMDENKLADVLRAMAFPEERVQVELAAAKAARDSDAIDLSVSEVEQAYKANVLSDVEAGNYLQKIGIDASGIPILLRTWSVTTTKSGTKLNAGILQRAYHDGLLDESALLQKLQSLGWNPSDARLLVKIAQWQSPEKPKELSEALIATAYTQGVMTQDQAVSRLQELGFGAEDAKTILRVHTILPKHAVKTLTPAEIAKGVELGAIGEQEALSRFEQQGYSAVDASLLFTILTSKVAATKQSKPPKTLSEAQITTAWAQGLISTDEALTDLKSIGYSQNDAELILAEHAPKAPPTTG